MGAQRVRRSSRPLLFARHRGALALALALGASCGADPEPGAEEGSDGTCEVGSEGCACTSGGTCDPGLVCASTICVDPGAGEDSASGAEETSATDSSTTSDSTDTETDDGTTSGTDDGEASDDTGDTGTSSGSTESGESTGGGDAVAYHGVFVHGASADSECDKWTTFRGELVGKSFTRITMSGSEDTVGRSCEGPTADTICQNIAQSAPATIFCDGAVWSTGDCSAGLPELDAGSAVCSCESSAYSVRPCHALNMWGGLNTDSCDTPTQTIDVVCE